MGAANRSARTGSLIAVIRRAAPVLAAMRRRYEPSLWRDEVRAQIRRVASGTRAGTTGGRDHDRVAPHCYASRSAEAALWLRPGTGDAAIWGEINVRGVYRSPWPIPAGTRVLDLGGHVGYFGRWALANWPVSEVVSVEPDAANADLLVRNAGAVGDERWRLIRAAATTRSGTAAFAGGRGAGSGLRAGGEDMVNTIDALRLLSDCDFAKIDIEGAEWTVLADGRFATSAPAMLVLEYHRTPAVPNPGSEARGRLEAAGFEVEESHPEEVPGVGVIWARRR
jgi:FkbM family methyltransferase